MDRRGRGLSGAYREGHTSQTDVEDIKAIVDEANTHSIFAISVGAVIALQAALMLTNIEKLAVYEPLLFPNQSAATALMARYGQEMAQGKVAAALATAMKGGQMGPPLINALPH